MHVVRRALPAILIAMLLAEESRAAPDEKAGHEFFENKIRPILVDHCLKCHSSKKKSPKAGLVLDTRSGMLSGGDSGPSIVPGKPDESLLIEVVRYQNPDLQMPPRQKLSDSQIADLVRWVEMGAPDPRSPRKAGKVPGTSAEQDFERRLRDGWCWQPVARPAIPDVRAKDWARDDIDRFILEKLDAKGIEPNADADRRTWIRRLTFDLTGLPPTPAEVDAFVSDESPSAVSDLVDRLLGSPHYGEHWGQHWLDLVRFAETRGHEQDYAIPEAWRYRDYVVRAFNADVPYDDWIIEHVAGDLVAEPRLDPADGSNQSLQGTGFWHFGEATHSPVDIRGDEADRVHNQIDVFSKTFLGLSVGCARCHEHKFDPITQADYYALFGYLQSSSFQLADVSDPRRQDEAARKIDSAEQAAVEAVRQSFVSAKRVQLERFSRYLAAAIDVLDGSSRDGQSAAARAETADVVFADFESGTYDGWKVEGSAFGDRPQSQKTIAPYQGNVGAQGKGFVNSHVALSGKQRQASDGHTGTLTSREFEISHDCIHFLVGGGAHAGKTCVELLVGDRVVRTQSGFNSNRMRRAFFEVSELRGRKARLRVADRVTAGWGNIGVDHIVFSATVPGQDRAPADDSAGTKDDRQARLGSVASARRINADVLGSVVLALEDAEKDAESPLHAFVRLARAAHGDSLASRAGGLLRSWKERAAESRRTLDAEMVTRSIKDGERNYKPERHAWTEEEVVVDYGRLEVQDWIPSGQRFGKGPRRVGEIILGTADEPMAAIVTRGYADAARGSQRFSGFLRTPTFEVRADRLWFRARGNFDAFIAMDSHRVVHGPLHGVMRQNGKKGDGDRWKWHSVNLRDYLGHRIHVEFTPRSNFALDRVVFADRGVPDLWKVNTRLAAWVESHGPGGSPKTGDRPALARSFSRMLRESIEAFAAGTLGEAEQARSHAELLSWMLRKGELFEPNESNTRKAASVVSSFRERQSEAENLIPATVRALALLDGSAEDEPLHVRGNHRSRSKDPVPRAILTALRKPGEAPTRTARGSGRLDLARRLTRPDNPLVARVLVNRVWHHLFGRGIVASVDDFGAMGQKPSHPELLDHLATRFIDGDWSIKKLIRTIVLSSVYRQSSRANANGAEVDPENVLLHRMRIRRLAAESIRDKILAVSGRLDRRLHGKSTMVHITPFMRSNRSPRGSGPLDGDGRRSIYTEVRRNHLSPMLLAFDKPIPFTTIGRRSLSNAPAQPLILLNDPLVHQQAEIWAKRLLREHPEAGDAHRLAIAYAEAFGRPPRADETESLLAFLDHQAKAYEGESHLRAWTDLCHTLFNVKEFIFLD